MELTGEKNICLQTIVGLPFLRNSLRWEKWRSNHFDKWNIRISKKCGEYAITCTKNASRRDSLSILLSLIIGRDFVENIAVSNGNNITTLFSCEEREERK